MHPVKDPAENEWSKVNLAFSKQAEHFDSDDLANPILQSWRRLIYDHVEEFLRPGDRMLELNAGTGIDAFHFAKQGYSILATDLSTGMINEFQRKLSLNPISALSCKQISFTNLNELEPQHFDYVFSNFGGLNCLEDLNSVTRHFHKILNPDAYVTWVVMPQLCPWELVWLIKGKYRDAMRRFRSGGAMAHLEGEYFQTYYHSLSNLRESFDSSFKFVKSEGLGVFSAPPGATGFYNNFPRIQHTLQNIDSYVKTHFPFNRWGDHIIVTFQYKP